MVKKAQQTPEQHAPLGNENKWIITNILPVIALIATGIGTIGLLLYNNVSSRVEKVETKLQHDVDKIEQKLQHDHDKIIRLETLVESSQSKKPSK